MVYCGKPSKGCSNCRERKIRCDQRAPGCGQCEKRQQQCPGYRNLVDLMFRDESSHVIKKANAKARKRSGTTTSAKTTPSPSKPVPQPATLSSSPSASFSTSKPSRKKGRARRYSSSSSSAESGSDSPPSAFTSTFQLDPAPKAGQDTSRYVKQEPETPSTAGLPAPAELPTPVSSGYSPTSTVDLPGPAPCRYSPSYEERGLNLFIARYISIPSNSCQNKFDFVFDFWTPSTSPEERAADPVLASLSSVGLLGIAQMSAAQPALAAARKSYGQALRLTNAALRDPVQALKDSTFLSVLVLSVFETMADHPGRRSMAAWQQHINGAAALARTRGLAQFRSKAGVRMFMLQVTNTMISCIQNELPMPKDLIDLREQLMAMLGGARAAPGYEICTPIYKILQLKYDIKQGAITDLDEMLATFNECENDFERAIALFPDGWRYETFRLTDRLRPGFYSMTCHIYPNIHIATIWNGMRTCRMLILETLSEELNKRFSRVPVAAVPARYQLEYQKAKFKLRRDGLAILATVPQHFGTVAPTGDTLDRLTPVSNSEEVWPPKFGSDWEVPPLGDSDGSDSAAHDEEEHFRHPSLSNPMQAHHPEAQAERWMILTSQANSLVWPLYLVGMSTASSPAMKAFVVERLQALFEESGSPQAVQLANAVTKQSQSRRATPRKSANFGCNGHMVQGRQSQRPLVF